MRFRPTPILFLAASAILVASCLDAPTAPRARSGALALAPRFAHAVAAGIVDVTAVRVTLERTSPAGIVVDTVITFPPGAEEVSLTLRAPIEGSSESFLTRLAMVNALGDTVFRAGPTPVTLTTEPTPTIVEPELNYTGPGASAASVRFVQPPSTLSFGDTVLLVAEAVDGQSNTIPDTPIGFALADSSDSLRARIPDRRSGQLVAGTQRGTVVVRAFTPADLGTTHQITVQPVPTGLEIAGGAGQSAAVGEALAEPFVARVTAADALGVAGVEVVFAVTSGDGTLSDTTVVTDAAGEARTVLTVGAAPGAQSVTATATGVGAPAVVFTANATAGAPARLEFETQPVNGTADAPLGAVQVRVVDADGFLVDTATRVVTMTLAEDPSGLNPLGGTLNVAAVGGIATFNDLTITAAAAGYRLDASAAGLLSATSDLFDVAAGAAVSLAFVAEPPPAIGSGVLFDVELVARDAEGNTAADFTGLVTLALDANPGAATLSGTLSVNAVAGVASFVGLSVDNLASGYTLLATSTGLTAAVSGAFDVEPPPEVNAWINPAGGNWNVAANWSRGTVPTGTDTVWIRQSGTYTVTVNDTRTIGPLVVGASIGTQTLAITGGNVTFADTAQFLAFAQLAVSGGTVTGGGLLAVDGTFAWTGGALQGGGGTLRVAAGGTLDISGTLARTLNGFTVELGGTGTWRDTHTINSGSVGTLRVLAGGALDITGDVSFIQNQGGLASILANAGTIVRSTSAGVVSVTASWENDGALQVETGTVQFGGGGTQSGSTAVDAGATVRFTGGTHALDGASAVVVNGRADVTTGTVNVAGAWTGAGRVEVLGGTLAYSAPTGSVDSLAVAGGTLGGAAGGLLTVTDAMTWTGGALQGTGGGVRVAVGGTLDISGATARTLNNYTLELAGTGTWRDAHTVNSGSGGTFRVAAGASLEVQGDVALVYNQGGAASQLVNLGTIIRNTSAGGVNVTAQWNNDGDVQLSTGTVALGGGGTQTGGTTVASGATLQFTGGVHALDAGSTLALNGRATVTNGTVNVAGPWTGTGRLAVQGGTWSYSAAGGSIDSLAVSGGTLAGAAGGLLTVVDEMTWTGGALQGTGGGVRVAVGATLDISGTMARTLNNYALELAGTGVWRDVHNVNSGSIGILRVLAGGTLDIQGDPSFLQNQGGGASQFVNLGTVLRTTSTAAATLTTQWINDGDLQVTSGTLTLGGGGTQSGTTSVAAGAVLQYSNGAHTLDAASTHGVTGRAVITGGTVNVAGAWTGVGRLDATGGTIAYSAPTGGLDTLVVSTGTFGGAAGGLFSVGTRMEWTGGALQGSGATVRVTGPATLDISGAASRTLNNLILELAGTGTWRDAHTVNSGSIGTFRVLAGGTLDIQGDPTVFYNQGGGTSTFENLGAVTRSTSVGNATFSLPVTLSSAVDVQSGAIVLTAGGTLGAPVTAAAESALRLASGTFVMQPGFGASGGGDLLVDGGTLNGLAAGDTAVIDRLDFATGTIAHTAGSVLRMTTLMRWTAGTVSSGVLHIPLASQLTMVGTAARSLSGATVDVFGRLGLEDALTLNTGSAATIRVQPGALLEFAQPPATTATIAYTLGGGFPLLDTQGELRLATAASAVVGVPLDLSGVANVTAGTLNLTASGTISGTINNTVGTTLFNGGTYTFADSALVTGSGGTAIAGGTFVTATATDTARFTALNFTGGTFAQTGTFEFGTLNWSAGAMTGTGNTLALTTLAMSGTTARTFTNGRIESFGTATRSGDFVLNTGGGARFVNHGTFNWDADGSHLYSQGGALSVFENLGTFVRTGATAASVATIGAQFIDTVSTGFSLDFGELHLTNGGRFGGSPYLGGVLQLAGGAFSMRTGTSWGSDGGVMRLTAGSLTADSAAVITMPPFALLGGTLAHEATLDFDQVFDWTGGTISSNIDGAGGATRLLNGGAMLIAGAAAKTFQGTHLISTDAFSSVTQNGTGAVNVGGGARIQNAGDFQLAGSGGFAYTLGGTLPQFENLATGTVRAQGATTGTIDLLFTNSGGAFEVTGDSLRLTRGSTGAFTGTATVNSSALVLGGGTFTLTGALTVSGTAADLAVTGGELALAGQTVTVGRDFSTRGTGTIASTAAASLLDVGRDATFAGGASTPSAGRLHVAGDVVQAGAATAFAPTAAFTVRLDGASDQLINFANPTTSAFRRLEVASGERGVVIETDVVVNDSLVMEAGAWNYDLTGLGDSQRLTVTGGVRVAQGTGNPLLAPPVLVLTTAPAVAPFPVGRGMSPDTTVYTGASVTTLPTAPGIRYNSIRLANGQSVVMLPATITGDLHVSSGTAAFGGNTTFNVGGKLRTTSTGAVAMTDPTANVTVADSAIFTGGSTTGLLTAGFLRVQGDFVQGGATSSSFRATGLHHTEFSGSVPQSISMANSGAGATNSRFSRLDLDNLLFTPVRVTLETDVFATWVSDTSLGVQDSLVSVAGALLSADSVSLQNTLFNNVRLAVTGGGSVPLGGWSSLTFENMDPASTYLYLDLNETSTVNITGATFATPVTTGYYVHANQINALLGAQSVVNLLSPVTPAVPGGGVLRTFSLGGILPSVVWLGVPVP